MEQIKLPTSPEMRAAFAELRLTLYAEKAGEEEYWDYNGAPAFRLYADRKPMFFRELPVMVSAHVLQLLGQLPPPPGMVMVPRNLCVWAHNTANNLVQHDEEAITRHLPVSFAQIDADIAMRDAWIKIIKPGPELTPKE